MKISIIKIIILFLFLVGVIGCSPSVLVDQNIMQGQSDQTTSLPAPTTPIKRFPTPTSTPGLETTNPSLTVTPVSTLPIPPLIPLISAFEVKQQCLQIESEIPVDKLPKEKAVIDDNLKEGISYFWNFETGQKENIPGFNQGDIIPLGSVSPDQKWLIHKNVRDHNLTLLNNNDLSPRIIKMQIVYLGVLQWLTNQEYAIWDDHGIYLYGVEKGFIKQIFDNYRDLPNFNLNGVYRVVLDPLVERLVYPSINSYNLVDIPKNGVIKQIPARSTLFMDMHWSNNGNYLYMLLAPTNGSNLKGNPGDKLLVLDRNGNLIQWIVLKGYLNKNLFFSGISLSPDEHYASFWVQANSDITSNNYAWNLVVLDMVNQSAKDYCLKQYNNGFQIRPARWSQDGNQLIMDISPKAGSKDVVLLDIPSEKAYRVVKDAIADDWMETTDK